MGFIDGVMVSMLVSNAVDRGFIDGIMVSMLVSSTVDRGFIDSVMVMYARFQCRSSWVHRWCNG